MIRSDEITIVTSAGGAFTGSTQDFQGLLHALIYVPGTLDTGADLTVTDPVSGVALWTETDAGTSVRHIMPRAPTVTAADAAILYAATFAVNDKFAIVGRVQVVVAQGGATLTGKLYVIWED